MAARSPCVNQASEMFRRLQGQIWRHACGVMSQLGHPRPCPPPPAAGPRCAAAVPLPIPFAVTSALRSHGSAGVLTRARAVCLPSCQHSQLPGAPRRRRKTARKPAMRRNSERQPSTPCYAAGSVFPVAGSTELPQWPCASSSRLCNLPAGCWLQEKRPYLVCRLRLAVVL